MHKLYTITIPDFTTTSGAFYEEIPLSYQIFGKRLGEAPIVLINHALTGNSEIIGENGWWNAIVGDNKVIDTNIYTILSFNIPGNGFDGYCVKHYDDFIAKDIARLFLIGLSTLQINKLFAIIGGSLGGAIGWEMMAIHKSITSHFIPIATDWKATDWLIANCKVQEQILKNSKEPVKDARIHAMLFYRTPESLNTRFHRTKNINLGVFNIESWLLHHGEKLQKRFQLNAYLHMNNLLKSIAIKDRHTFLDLAKIKASIHLIGIDSDLFFTAEENKKTYQNLKQYKKNIHYFEIQSIHGHDAFLIEYEQLESILKPIFKLKKIYRSIAS